MSRDLRPTFDPAADFYVTRPFKCGGRNFAPGDLFDKSLIEPRRLKQMYETLRQVRQEAPKETAKPRRAAVRAAKPDKVERFRPAV